MANPVTPSALPTEPDILPKTPEESAAPGEEVTPELPPEVLEISAMHGLLRGAPPAVYTEANDPDPEVRTVVKNKNALVAAGFGFYRSDDKKLSVLYNGVYVTEEQLNEADKAGKLAEVAVPLSQVRSDYEGAISGDVSPGQPISAAAAGSPPSVGAQKRVTTARLKNLQPGAPTSGPSPGAGRIINNILSPAI